MARRSSQKSRRDANAPKQSPLAWRMFFDENRKQVSKENPNFSYVEVSKKLGEMWRQSDDATKRHYQKQYQTNQAEYTEKMAAYKEQKKNRQSSGSKKQNTGRSKKENNNDNNNNNESNQYDNQY